MRRWPTGNDSDVVSWESHRHQRHHCKLLIKSGRLPEFFLYSSVLFWWSSYRPLRDLMISKTTCLFLDKHLSILKTKKKNTEPTNYFSCEGLFWWTSLWYSVWPLPPLPCPTKAKKRSPEVSGEQMLFWRCGPRQTDRRHRQGDKWIITINDVVLSLWLSISYKKEPTNKKHISIVPLWPLTFDVPLSTMTTQQHNFHMLEITN